MEQTTNTKPIELIECATRGCRAVGTVDEFERVDGETEADDLYYCSPCDYQNRLESEGDRIYEMMRDREMGL